MGQIGYVTKLLKGAHYKKMIGAARDIAKKSHRTTLGIILDMAHCFIFYGAGYHDYRTFEFYNLKNKNRKTYVTRIRHKKVVSMFNDPAYSDIIDKKDLFNVRFKDYLHRDTIDIDSASLEDFKKFMKNKTRVICKPHNLDSGRGIEFADKKDYKKIEDLYEYLKSKNLRIVEEVVKQHKDLNKMYPDAINCLRLVTLVVNGKPEIIYGVQKLAANGAVIDNTGFGSMWAPVDLKTGKLTSVGHREDGKQFKEHPNSKLKIKGFQVPLFDEAVELVKKAALEIPEVKYIGWDVFIGEKGPGIIEGNDYPDYLFTQLPEHTPDKIGLWPYYKDAMKREKRGLK